jgi:hypothetical protein
MKEDEPSRYRSLIGVIEYEESECNSTVLDDTKQCDEPESISVRREVLNLEARAEREGEKGRVMNGVAEHSGDSEGNPVVIVERSIVRAFGERLDALRKRTSGETPVESTRP